MIHEKYLIYKDLKRRERVITYSFGYIDKDSRGYYLHLCKNYDNSITWIKLYLDEVKIDNEDVLKIIQ